MCSDLPQMHCKVQSHHSNTGLLTPTSVTLSTKSISPDSPPAPCFPLLRFLLRQVALKPIPHHKEPPPCMHCPCLLAPSVHTREPFFCLLGPVIWQFTYSESEWTTHIMTRKGHQSTWFHLLWTGASPIHFILIFMSNLWSQGTLAFPFKKCQYQKAMSPKSQAVKRRTVSSWTVCPQRLYPALLHHPWRQKVCSLTDPTVFLISYLSQWLIVHLLCGGCSVI